MQLPPARSSLQLVAAGCAALLVLALPGPASADHVSATFSATAKLRERSGKSWRVEVEWSITCTGASDPLYFGDISLVDQGSGESIFLGGTSHASGKTSASVAMKTTPRTLKPRMNSSCGEPLGGHGSGSAEFFGSEVVVPALSCDPDLLAKALREFEVAKSFYLAGAQDLRNAHDEFVESRDEYVKESAKIGAEKAAGIQLIHLLGEDILLATEVTAFWVGIGVTIEEVLLKLIPSLKETAKAFREAREDFERGEAWTARAKADLAKALEEGPCVGDLRTKLNKALDDQREQERARALIESWENNGYLYLNPATGELLDEAAALREARRVLASQRATQSRAVPAKRRVFATRRQIEAAVRKLTTARALNERARVRVQRADAAAERLRTRLQALLR